MPPKERTGRERLDVSAVRRGKREGSEGKGGRIKIEVHCGRRFFVLSTSTSTARSAYGENFIFVHFSSSNQFQKLDYFLPSHKASRPEAAPVAYSIYVCTCI